MREHWVTTLYQRIKQERDVRLAQVLSILRRKAADDPEIKVVLDLLEPWEPTAPAAGPQEDATDTQKRQDPRGNP